MGSQFVNHLDPINPEDHGIQAGHHPFNPPPNPAHPPYPAGGTHDPNSFASKVYGAQREAQREDEESAAARADALRVNRNVNNYMNFGEGQYAPQTAEGQKMAMNDYRAQIAEDRTMPIGQRETAASQVKDTDALLAEERNESPDMEYSENEKGEISPDYASMASVGKKVPDNYANPKTKR